MDKPFQIDENLWDEIDKIEGWLSLAEADQLHRLCNGTWCEIGSWKGKSTRVLAQNQKGYAIDTFKGSSEHGPNIDTLAAFKKNTEPVKDNITILPEDYKTAVGKVIKPIQLLFLDAEHTYEATKEALELYLPMVRKGGVIVIHDVWAWDFSRDPELTPYPGVTKYAYELLEDPRFEHLEDAHRSMAVVKL